MRLCVVSNDDQWLLIVYNLVVANCKAGIAPKFEILHILQGAEIIRLVSTAIRSGVI